MNPFRIECPEENFHITANKYYIIEWSPGVTESIPSTIYKCTCGCIFRPIFLDMGEIYSIEVLQKGRKENGNINTSRCN